MANVSLAWLLGRPGVTSILMGARNADQVTRNLGAIKVALPSATMRALEEATDGLKAAIGDNLDPYESSANNRIS